MKKLKLYISWFIKIIISIGFILASMGKLAQSPAVIDMFKNWGYFDGFYLIIGGLELILAILVIIPRTTLLATVGLFVIMFGALITHLIHDPAAEMLRPGIFMVFLLICLYFEKNKNK